MNHSVLQVRKPDFGPKSPLFWGEFDHLPDFSELFWSSKSLSIGPESLQNTRNTPNTFPQAYNTLQVHIVVYKCPNPFSGPIYHHLWHLVPGKKTRRLWLTELFDHKTDNPRTMDHIFLSNTSVRMSDPKVMSNWPYSGWDRSKLTQKWIFAQNPVPPKCTCFGPFLGP